MRVFSVVTFLTLFCAYDAQDTINLGGTWQAYITTGTSKYDEKDT